MYSKWNEYSFHKIKQRIKEVKEENTILCKKFNLSTNTLQNIERPANLKNNILDYNEVSAVENCYKKATELTKHYKKPKAIRKQWKADLHSKSNLSKLQIPFKTSDLVKSPLSKSYKKSQDRTKNIKNVSNNIKNPAKVNKLDVMKKPLKTAIPEINLTEDPVEEIMLDLDESNLNKMIELDKVIEKPKKLIELYKMKKTDKALIPEINLTEDPVEEIIIDPDELNTNEAIKPKHDIGIKKWNKTGISKVESMKLDKMKKHVKAVIPESELTEDSIEEIIDLEDTNFNESTITMLDTVDEIYEGDKSKLDFKNMQDEVILPELDFTEEPVDFVVPEIHISESTGFDKRNISNLKSSDNFMRKKGLWSKKEEELLQRNMENFQFQFNVYDPRILLGFGRRILFSSHDCKQIKKFLRAKHFYIRLGKDINNRTLDSIYVKAREMFNPYKKFEDIRLKDIAAVIAMQKKYGNRWSLIAQKLGISYHVCHRIYFYHKKPHNKGAWSESEKKNLISAVKYIRNISNTQSLNFHINFWEKIAGYVPSRNARQCYDEWKKYEINEK